MAEAEKTAENPVAGAVHAWLDAWGAALKPLAEAGRERVAVTDKRFKAPEWDHPVFDLIRQNYLAMTDAMLAAVDQVPGLDDRQRAQARFAARAVADLMSPANSPFSNPVALDRALATNGESLARGFTHLLEDLSKGQLTHSNPEAFELGRNIAATPGKVIHETPLYQLIQYTPTTETVLRAPLIIFPPWINRFYILDLTPEKSFIRWAVEQGVTVFVVSWRSADETLKDIVWNDYVQAQIDTVDLVCDLLEVEAAHVIGYCVAGTTLAATLAVLSARGEAERIKSATFLTAQVDFSDAGDLLHFVDETQLALIDQISAPGYLDGRWLAHTFNLLRGNDLIWSSVGKHYLLGEERPAFDLLHWNGDVTNLPATWHNAYLRDLYRDNKLVQPGAMTVLSEPVDLRRVTTPCYIQAGREDHIAPAKSVWKLTEQFRGPLRFVLAGSGHIAGVVNPPAANKYQHWVHAGKAASLEQFVAEAEERRGSWWPDWLDWLRSQDLSTVTADGARVPGAGKLPALEDAPGRYVRTR